MVVQLIIYKDSLLVEELHLSTKVKLYLLKLKHLKNQLFFLPAI